MGHKHTYWIPTDEDEVPTECVCRTCQATLTWDEVARRINEITQLKAANAALKERVLKLTGCNELLAKRVITVERLAIKAMDRYSILKAGGE